MKKSLFSLVAAIWSFALIAQENVPEEVRRPTEFSDRSKWIMVTILILIIIIIVLRTFRNKPTV